MKMENLELTVNVEVKYLQNTIKLLNEKVNMLETKLDNIENVEDYSAVELEKESMPRKEHSEIPEDNMPVNKAKMFKYDQCKSMFKRKNPAYGRH